VECLVIIRQVIDHFARGNVLFQIMNQYVSWLKPSMQQLMRQKSR